MTVTAARLGSAPITLDWSNLKFQKMDASAAGAAWQKLRARFSSRESGFYDTPVDESLSQEAACRDLAQRLLETRKFTDCVFLGIGGSALGPLSLLAALPEKTRSGVRFHFLENPDPLDCKSKMDSLDPDRTVVCAIAKSGTTFETLAQLLVFADWLGQSRWKSNLIIITDPEKGDLRAWARQEGLETLTIAPSVGGRFSIFTPVGLFAAALAGMNIEDFLKGARQVRDYCEKTPVEKNALFAIGSDLVRQASDKPIHVCMPYSTRLRPVGAWWVQLWGESLGKDGKGFTPIQAVGATDQHSILQLLRDGPNDKITFFVTIDQVQDEVTIPKLGGAGGPPQASRNFPAFRILEGHTLHQLLQVEYRATSLVLTRQGRPHLTFLLDRLDERTMGALFFAWAVLTAFTGTLMGVDPFNQPGVEEGKIYIREALSKEPVSSRTKEEDENSPVNRLRRPRPEPEGDF